MQQEKCLTYCKNELLLKGYDALVVGAGLCGSVIARELADNGKRVLIIERRSHIAGNLYDFMQDGILVQKYGPHTFHTNSKSLKSFIERFCSAEELILQCKVYMHGKFTPSPFNFKTIDDYYEKPKGDKLKEALLKEYSNRKSVTIVELLQSNIDIIKEYADFLFNSDYSLYTAKQWGIKPEQVDVNVLKRVPVLLNYDEQYFYDKYQFMPIGGFTEFIKRMLAHDNIDVLLNTDFFNVAKIDDRKIFVNDREYDGIVVFTGELDRLFNYKYGALPYRSLEFKFEKYETQSYQQAPVVAYPEDKEYTRITEYTKLPVQNKPWTVIAKEYPRKYEPNVNEPYYPITNAESNAIYAKYLEEANRVHNLVVCGRLADFKYYNMDQAIERALTVSDKLLERW